MTRLTNAFSKKWSKLHDMMALYFAHSIFAECMARFALRQRWKRESRITFGRCENYSLKLADSNSRSVLVSGLSPSGKQTTS